METGVWPPACWFVYGYELAWVRRDRVGCFVELSDCTLSVQGRTFIVNLLYFVMLFLVTKPCDSVQQVVVVGERVYLFVR